MAQSDADKIVRAINALTAELKHHRPKRGRVQVLKEPYRVGIARAFDPSLEYQDDSGYDCD